MILANFPFSSETKRMGIIIKHEASNRIIFYLKGADMVMIDKCKLIYRGYIQDECDTLAREGLRTLVIAQK
jgi:phospholipid-translocating ATPase